MLRRSLFAIGFLALGLAHGQEHLKELTIKDAIMKAGSDFAPESVDGLQWIPSTDDYCYIKDDVLMRGSQGKKADLPIVALAELNRGLSAGEQFKGFPDVEWTGGGQFQVRNGEHIYAYDLAKKTLTSTLQIPATAEREDADPTHTKVAFTQGEDLYIAGLDANGPARVTTDGADGIVNGRSVHREEYGITKGTFWDPTGGKLAFYRMDESMVSPYYLEDITTKPSTFKKIRYPMAGQTSHHVTLGVYDLKTRKTVFMHTTGAADDYLTNISWDPTGKYVFIIHLNRATDHLRVVQYDAVSGEPLRTLIEEDDKKWLEPLHELTFLKRAPTQFIYTSQKDGWPHLYLYDLANVSMRQLTKGDWVVKNIIGLNEKETAVFVEGTDVIDPKDPKGALETSLYRVELSSGKTTRLTTLPGTHHGSLSTSGNSLIDTWSSLTVPGRTEIIDGANGMVKKNLLTSKDPLAGMKVGTIEFTQVKGENGDMLNARLIKPHDFQSRKQYPVIVYVYNGPHVQLVSDRFLGGASLWMLQAAERGYIVFTLDGHGSDNRGRDFEQVIHRQLGVVEVKDQLHGVDYLKSLPYVDGDRLAVHGWSFGGHMTVAMLLRAPGVFKAGVAGGAVMDWSMYEVMYTERYMDTPAQNPDGYALTQLPDKVSALKDHLLLIHDNDDDTVLPEHAMKFLKSAVDKGVQFDFFMYPGHPHNVRGKDRVHLYTQVLDYIDAQLAPGK